MKPSIGWNSLLLAIVLAPSGAFGQAAAMPNDATRLGQAAARMMPLGDVLEAAAKDDPTWPITGKPNVMDARQLACVRENLGERQFQEMMVKRAESYVHENPARIAEDLRLLEGGGGQLFARMVSEGIKAQRGKQEMDANQLMVGATPEDIAGMMALASDPRNQPLRVLIGFDQTITNGDSGKRAGHSAALTFMVPMLMGAMSACNVPTSALLK